MTDSDFASLLADARPKLHRYCARMTVSVIDGEDVLDFLRRRARTDARFADEDPEMMNDPNDEQPDPDLVATSLHSFMRLPRVQRSSVILMDVLGYSLAEIGEIMESSLPAVKSALHRGRTRLHEIGNEPGNEPLPQLSGGEGTLLAGYIDRFNARDYDAVRAMLADEIHLELVNRRELRGRAEVDHYYTNYGKVEPKRFALGFVDGRPAILVYEPAAPDVVAYVILLAWDGTHVAKIRDFLYAPYAVEGASIVESHGLPSERP